MFERGREDSFPEFGIGSFGQEWAMTFLQQPGKFWLRFTHFESRFFYGVQNFLRCDRPDSGSASSSVEERAHAF